MFALLSFYFSIRSWATERTQLPKINTCFDLWNIHYLCYGYYFLSNTFTPPGHIYSCVSSIIIKYRLNIFSFFIFVYSILDRFSSLCPKYHKNEWDFKRETELFVIIRSRLLLINKYYSYLLFVLYKSWSYIILDSLQYV